MIGAEMIAGIPYIITRGSAALHLVAGDRIEVCVGTGSLIDQRGVRRREWRGYQLNVEMDPAGCLEQARCCGSGRTCWSGLRLVMPNPAWSPARQVQVDRAC